MLGKIFRFMLFLAFIAGLPHANPTMKAQARAGEISNTQYLEMLADVQGVPSASLELADVGTVELIDGSTVTRVKASIDRRINRSASASETAKLLTRPPSGNRSPANGEMPTAG